MNILFISHKYPPSIGGMEKQSYELVEGFRPHSTVHTILFKGNGSKLSWFWNLQNRVLTYLSENNIDLIHLNDGLLAFFLRNLPSKTKIPVVVTVHGLDITFPNKIYQRKIIPKFNGFAGVIAVSNSTGQDCIARGISKEKVFVVQNGVDHDLEPINDVKSVKDFIKKEHKLDLNDKKIIVTLGRAVRRKGFSWFAKNVMPELDNNTVYLAIGTKLQSSWSRSLIPSFLLDQIDLFLGTENDVKSLVRLRDNHNNIILLGKIKFDYVRQLLSLADAFVMPNIEIYGDKEGFGLVTLEAALHECLVVASKSGGITDAVIDGKNGILLSPGQTDLWVNTLKEKLSKTDSNVEFCKKARLYTLDNFGWKKMVDGYLQVFRKLT